MSLCGLCRQDDHHHRDGQRTGRQAAAVWFAHHKIIHRSQTFRIPPR
jgi:hypothetical protein